MNVRIPDAVIGGGGIIGLSLALELASHGLQVTVLERGVAMREASWAAAGMLAARDPENPPELRALADFSLALYPEFLARVAEWSGVAVPLRTQATLQAVPLQQASVAPGEVLRRVPDLRTGGRSFVLLDEQSLDPRELCAALPVAVRAAGVALQEHTGVHAVRPDGEGVVVETDAGVRLRASHFIHCCGAWSGELACQDPLPMDPVPVEPRKGQMLALDMPLQAPRLACVLRTPELYLVPRTPGAGQRIVVGASVEDAGFDRSVDSATTDALLAAAAELWPPVLDGVIGERWTGLRPCSPDRLPVIGRWPGRAETASLWVATGHFRNGILLAPGTARLIRQAMAGEAPAVDLAPFRRSRFAPVPAA
ncbi:MAG TPA: FAD-dependent oxidoreductase [Acidobacteriaceae bacterium]